MTDPRHWTTTDLEAHYADGDRAREERKRRERTQLLTYRGMFDLHLTPTEYHELLAATHDDRVKADKLARGYLEREDRTP